jgi:hypothetical protein
MKESLVADLKPGSSVNTTILVQDKELKTSSSGNADLDVRLGDCTGSIRAIFQDG